MDPQTLAIRKKKEMQFEILPCSRTIPQVTWQYHTECSPVCLGGLERDPADPQFYTCSPLHIPILSNKSERGEQAILSTFVRWPPRLHFNRALPLLHLHSSENFFQASPHDAGVSLHPIHSSKAVSPVLRGYSRPTPYWNLAQRHKSQQFRVVSRTEGLLTRPRVLQEIFGTKRTRSAASRSSKAGGVSWHKQVLLAEYAQETRPGKEGRLVGVALHDRRVHGGEFFYSLLGTFDTKESRHNIQLGSHLLIDIAGNQNQQSKLKINKSTYQSAE
ncbi:hypothetical protein Y032_0538g3129 [Ancylostoma ceylanicum]|uniref:Uncharacterized protein n=1 Tax=Ancylostoma ceylanicum TaxID=53326 RepID=A0A016WRC9_9BILA|nr:hypothetical protein Y032_0538g3129 [Ancylostoma ceylanicum]